MATGKVCVNFCSLEIELTLISSDCRSKSWSPVHFTSLIRFTSLKSLTHDRGSAYFGAIFAGENRPSWIHRFLIGLLKSDRLTYVVRRTLKPPLNWPPDERNREKMEIYKFGLKFLRVAVSISSRNLNGIFSEKSARKTLFCRWKFIALATKFPLLKPTSRAHVQICKWPGQCAYLTLVFIVHFRFRLKWSAGSVGQFLVWKVNLLKAANIQPHDQQLLIWLHKLSRDARVWRSSDKAGLLRLLDEHGQKSGNESEWSVCPSMSISGCIWSKGSSLAFSPKFRCQTSAKHNSISQYLYKNILFNYKVRLNALTFSQLKLNHWIDCRVSLKNIQSGRQRSLDLYSGSTCLQRVFLYQKVQSKLFSRCP
jgi:hypothetical protein